MSGFFMVLVVLYKTVFSFFGIFKIFTASKKQKEALSHIFKVNRKLFAFFPKVRLSLCLPIMGGVFLVLFFCFVFYHFLIVCGLNNYTWTAHPSEVSVWETFQGFCHLKRQ